MTTHNPFQPAAKVAKKLKILIYGASGVGKTLAALTFPRPAVIDTEGGTDLYAAREGIPAFSVLRAKSLTDVESAIKFIQADNGKTFETLVIDAITVLYDVQKDAAGKAAKKEDEMTPRDWNKVNKRMVNLYNALTNLPVHVVVVAREAELYEGEGLNLKRVGFKPDMDKKGVYIFDFIVRMTKDRSGEIIKSRGANVSNTMKTVNWAAFEAIAGMFTEGKQAVAIADDQAAETDARAYQDATPASHWSTNNDVLERMYAKMLTDHKATREDVNAAIADTQKPLTALTGDQVTAAVQKRMKAKNYVQTMPDISQEEMLLPNGGD